MWYSPTATLWTHLLDASNNQSLCLWIASGLLQNVFLFSFTFAEKGTSVTNINEFLTPLNNKWQRLEILPCMTDLLLRHHQQAVVDEATKLQKNVFLHTFVVIVIIILIYFTISRTSNLSHISRVPYFGVSYLVSQLVCINESFNSKSLINKSFIKNFEDNFLPKSVGLHQLNLSYCIFLNNSICIKNLVIIIFNFLYIFEHYWQKNIRN